MRIDLNSISLNEISPNQVDREEQARKAGKASSAPNVEDKASLSVDALSVSSLEEQAMSAPPVRQDKVEALRQAIQNGEYKPEPEKIAQAILEQNKR
jgi:negative regulator of flagellin synthesis FlgM